MKIVIDISEDVYTRLFDNSIQDNEISVDDICEMARAIRLGTPLSSSENPNKWKSIYEEMYQEKMRELNERKKELEIQLNVSVQNIIDNEMIMCCEEIENE
jgi:hypothetical protein